MKKISIFLNVFVLSVCLFSVGTAVAQKAKPAGKPAVVKADAVKAVVTKAVVAAPVVKSIPAVVPALPKTAKPAAAPKPPAAAPAKVEAAPAPAKSPAKSDNKRLILLAMIIIMGAAIVFGTVSLSVVGAKVVSGVVRNPGSRPAVMPLLLLSMALIESVVIYGLVVTVLLYAKL